MEKHRLRPVVIGAVLAVVALAGVTLSLSGSVSRERQARTTAQAQASLALQAQATAEAQRDTRATESAARSTAEAEARSARGTATRAEATATAAQATANAAAVREVSIRATREAESSRAEAALSRVAGQRLAFASMQELPQNHELALLLAVEAANESPSLEADTALRSALALKGYTAALLIGHRDPIGTIAWSPDGRYLMTAGYDAQVKIWWAQNGSVLASLEGHSYAVWNAAWSPDGHYVATASQDQIARVWKIGESGVPVGEWPVAYFYGHTEPVEVVAWSPDSRRLVTGGQDGTARVCDVANKTELVVFTGHEGTVYDARWSPDGRYILTDSTGGPLRVWDANTGVELTTGFARKTIVQADWSPPGVCAPAGCIVTRGKENVARIWDVATGEQLAVLRGHTGTVGQVLWSPDGSRILTSGSDGTIRTWDAIAAIDGGGDGAQHSILAGHSETMYNLAWSPDGRHLVSAAGKTASIWDADSGLDLAVLTGHTGDVWQAVWSPDGRHVATAGDEPVARVWDVSAAVGGRDTGLEQALLSGHTDSVEHVAWHPDGGAILTGSYDGTARLWDVPPAIKTRGEKAGVAVLSGHGDGDVDASWSPDGQYILTAGYDGAARLWDTETLLEAGDAASWLTLLEGHSGPVEHASWSPDGRRIATASRDGTVRAWDMAMAIDTGGQDAELLTLAAHEGGVQEAVWSPDGRRIVTIGSRDMTARVWDAWNGQPLATFDGHKEDWTEGLRHAEWSPDGGRIVTTGDIARVWDADSGAVRAALRHDPVAYAGWSPEGACPPGACLVLAGWDGKTHLWDGQTWSELALFSRHADGVVHAAWDPSGTRLVTASRDGTAALWDAGTGTLLAVLQGHTAGLRHAAWSPDGRYVATASQDGTARLWLTQIEDLREAACRRAVRNMSEKEWQRYMVSKPYRETCPGKPVPYRDYWASVPKTALQLRLRNVAGEPVAFSKAEILIESRSYWDTMTLTVESMILEVPLDKRSMTPPDFEYAQDDWYQCRLYVEAEGYVPLQTKPVACIGMLGGWGPSGMAVVEFPGSPAVEVARGETRQLELIVRAPQARYLRFIDDDQRPVAGVEVVSGVFWTNDNHCGHVINSQLGEGVSDQDGRVAIPDADVQYALFFEKPFYELKEGNPGYTGYLMTLLPYLSERETVVRLHRWQKRRLELVASRKGEPLIGARLLGDWTLAYCGFWEKELGTTDENGRIVIEDFYPDEWYEVYLSLDDERDPVWRADPSLLTGTVHVELEY